MKHIARALLLILAASLLPSCASTEAARREELTQLATTAVTVAQLSGKLTPKQAALLRQGGVLLLDAMEGKKPTLAQLSEIALGAALETGALQPEQAAALLNAGQVPLSTAALPAASK